VSISRRAKRTLTARNVVTPVGPPVQGYDRDVAGLFERKYPVADLGGGAIEQVRNESDPWPGHGRGQAAGNATRFRAAGGNHDVMSVGQGQRSRAARHLRNPARHPHP